MTTNERLFSETIKQNGLNKKKKQFRNNLDPNETTEDAPI